jgi:hypothetical protein
MADNWTCPVYLSAGTFDTNASINLKTSFGDSKFNNLNTGHSAQFVHGYRDVAAYWQKLKDDIEWEVQ